MRSFSPSSRWLAAATASLCLAAACATDARAQTDTSAVIVKWLHADDRDLGVRSKPVDGPPGEYLLRRREMLAELREARVRWTRARPAAYAFRVDRDCVCRGFEGDVAVRGDSARRTGEPDHQGLAPPTVEALFAELDHAIRTDDHRVSLVRFHPELGYPVAWTSKPAKHADSLDRVRVTIHDFRPLR